MVVPPQVRGALIAREIDAEDVLARISVPMLVTHGREDAIVLPSMAEQVLERSKTAVPSWYEGVGHMPFRRGHGAVQPRAGGLRRPSEPLRIPAAGFAGAGAFSRLATLDR